MVKGLDLGILEHGCAIRGYLGPGWELRFGCRAWKNLILVAMGCSSVWIGKKRFFRLKRLEINE